MSGQELPDSTEELQRILDEADERGIDAALPPGVHIITRTLVIPAGVRVAVAKVPG